MSNSPRKRPPGKPSTSRPGAARPASSRPGPARSSSGMRGWIIGAVVVVIVVLAGIVAISTSGDDDDTARGDAAPGAVDGATTPDGGSTAADAEPDASATPANPADAPGAAGTAENQAATVTGAALPPFPGNGESDPAIGTTIPSVTGAGFDGAPVTIEPGTPTLLVFLAHWCPHCQNEVPRLVDWQAAGEVPDGVDVIAVSTAVNPPRGNYPPSEWLTDEGWPWPALADTAESEVAQAFGLTSFPYFVLYDADGSVVQRVSGEVEMDDLTSIIEEGLGR